MPRDKRLYMTFPIDFADHPKIEQLSDGAFRAFVAMNGYCRQQRLDGRIPTAVAMKRWKTRYLSELIASDAEKPLILRDETAYIIRDYAEHQFTTADEAELHNKRAEAGKAGGKAKANALALAKQMAGKNVAGSGSGLEVEKTDSGDFYPPVTEVDAGEADETEFVRLEVEKLGIRHLDRIRIAFERIVGPVPSDMQVVDLARAVIVLALEPVRNVEAYLETACMKSPDQVRTEWARVDAEWSAAKAAS